MSQPKKKIRRLHHIGAPADPPARRVAPPYRCTHTHACTPLPPPPRTLSALPSPLVVSLLPGLLFLVFFLLFVFCLQGGPPPPRSKVICAMDAAELYYLNGRPFSPNSILPGRSSPVRPRQLHLHNAYDNTDLSLHIVICVTVIKGLLLRQRSGVSQLDSPLVFPRQLFFFLQCRTSTRHGRSTTGNGKD